MKRVKRATGATPVEAERPEHESARGINRMGSALGQQLATCRGRTVVGKF
jgi:hypothetical protein